jgi:tetratricopeptide (TPR) repeat protein
MMKFPQFTLYIWFLILSNVLYAQKYDTVQIKQMLDDTELIINTAPSKAISLSQKIHKYSLEANFEYGQIESQVNIAHCYSYLKQFEKTIEAASKAENLAVKFKDYYGLTDALRLKALAYSSLGYHSNAKETNKQGLEATYKISELDLAYGQRGLLYESYATILFNEDASIDSITYYDKKSIESYLKVNKNDAPELLTSGYVNLASDFLAAKQLDSAEFYYKKAQKLAETLDKDYDKIQILCDLGVICQFRGNHKRAIVYLQDAILAAKKFKDPYALKNIYQHISKSYEAVGNYKNAVENIKLYTVLNDSLLNSEKKGLITPMKQIIKDKESDFKKTRKNLYIIISISVLFIVICLYGGMFFYRKFKKEKLTAHQIEKLLNEKMEQINSVQPNVESEKINDGDLKHVVELAINDEPGFFIKFQELYPEFTKKLLKIAPSLIATELKFSAYLKLDFSTKEIARYTNLSVRAVEAKKYRLRKKLNIPTEVDTNIWISKI